MFSKIVLVLILQLAVVLGQEPTLKDDDGKPILCGETNVQGAQSYTTWEDIHICVLFENINGKKKKVLYTAKVDKFAVLELHGLYDLLKDQETVSLKVFTNGVMSRESYFKIEDGVAETLNLVGKIEMGVITGFSWENDCIEKTCKFEDCVKKTFKVFKDGQDYEETDKNCYIKTCENSKDTNNCDTKIFLTWTGNDLEDRYCESDNFRITNLIEHSIKTYFESAVSLADQSKMIQN